jgi:hypothetical protein
LCNTAGIKPDQLMPNRNLRISVQNFMVQMRTRALEDAERRKATG